MVFEKQFKLNSHAVETVHDVIEKHWAINERSIPLSHVASCKHLTSRSLFVRNPPNSIPQLESLFVSFYAFFFSLIGCPESNEEQQRQKHNEVAKLMRHVPKML